MIPSRLRYVSYPVFNYSTYKTEFIYIVEDDILYLSLYSL